MCVGGGGVTPGPRGYDPAMAFQLPPSLRKELHPVEDEVAWARSLTPEQRLIVVAVLCRDSVILLNMNERREAVLASRDPVPPSTTAALARSFLELRGQVQQPCPPSRRRTCDARLLDQRPHRADRSAFVAVFDSHRSLFGETDREVPL